MKVIRGREVVNLSDIKVAECFIVDNFNEIYMKTKAISATLSLLGIIMIVIAVVLQSDVSTETKVMKNKEIIDSWGNRCPKGELVHK